MNQEHETSADPLALRDMALNLRESVNSSRARLYAQRQQLTRLRAEISALRALAETRPAPAAAVSVPVPVLIPMPVPARAFVVPAPEKALPVVKEAVEDSAPEAASFKTDNASRIWKAAPYAALLAVGIAFQMQSVSKREAIPLTAVVPTAPSPAASAPDGAFEDDGADEAILLTHEFRLPGDERPLADRLDQGGNPPGSKPAWTAERTGERAYRVRYQSADDAAGYEFDVDLDSRRVDPTPDTAELIAPRLASRR